MTEPVRVDDKAPPSWLALQAREIVHHLRANGFADDGGIRQGLNLAEEAGEFVEAALTVSAQTGRFIGAFRRWKGLARRSSTEAEARSELADVVITAYVTAAELGWDLDAEIDKKLRVILSRGWREVRDLPDFPIGGAQ